MFVTRHRFPVLLASKQGGASILTAIFIITSLSVLGALMTKITIMSSQETINEMYSAQALYAAESGTDWAAYHIINNDTCIAGYPYTASVPVSTSSSVDVSINCYQPGKNGNTINLYHITVTGMAGGRAQRELSVQFIPTP